MLEKNVLFTKCLLSHKLPAPAELIVKTVILDEYISCFKAGGGGGGGLQTAFQPGFATRRPHFIFSVLKIVRLSWLTAELHVQAQAKL